MRATIRPMCLTLAAMLASAAWSASAAQAPPACSLATKAEVEQITGGRLFGDADLTPLAGGAGSACTYGGGAAQIVVYSGPDAQALWDRHVKSFGKENETRHPAPAAGNGAYIVYPTPRDRHEDTIGLLVVREGPHVLGISIAAAEGQTGESVQPKLVALTRAVVAKLR